MQDLRDCNVLKSFFLDLQKFAEQNFVKNLLLQNEDNLLLKYM